MDIMMVTQIRTREIFSNGGGCYLVEELPHNFGILHLVGNEWHSWKKYTRSFTRSICFLLHSLLLYRRNVFIKRKLKLLSQLDLVLMPKKRCLSCTVRYEKQLVILTVGINTFTRKYTRFFEIQLPLSRTVFF